MLYLYHKYKIDNKKRKKEGLPPIL